MKDKEMEIEIEIDKKNENENKNENKNNLNLLPPSLLSKKTWLKLKYEKFKKLKIYEPLKICFYVLSLITFIYIIIIIIIMIIVTTSKDFPMFMYKNSVDKYKDKDKKYKNFIFDKIKYNFKIPTRRFKTNIDLIDYDLMNITANGCSDFYEYSCGNFNKFGQQNEVFQIINNENKLKKNFINNGIIEEDQLLCGISGNNGCYNALEYYKNCVYDKNHGVQPIVLINKLIKKLNNISNTPFGKIRFLIKNGLTNFIHLTKENIIGTNWTHYLRPGGVLYPSKTIHLDLYGGTEEDLKSSQKQLITIDEFLNLMIINKKKWIKIFGIHAKGEDLLFIENLKYFENLDKLLKILPKEELNNRLIWFIQNDLNYFYNGHSCLDQTKLLFPITFCRIFQILSRLEDKENGIEIAKSIYNYMDNKYELTTSLRIGSCSSLLHSNNLGDELIKVEDQKEIIKYLKNMNSLEWAQEFLFKKWYKIYDPIYLFCTYPRILDENFLDDPLDWYAQVNAFYDRFHNEVVVPIGLIQYPLYSERYNITGIYSRIGYVFGHEISHSIQSTKDLSCLGENENFELFADIFGLLNTFEYYFINFKNITDQEICKFFLSYAQLFCAQNPDYKYDSHGSSRDRVNLAIDFSSINLLNEFNNCFNCKKIEKCINLKKN